jgi:hypothetical protein
VLTRLASGLLLRRLTTELHAISDALDRQNALLARIADRVAPLLPEDPDLREVVRADTGVTHLDVVDAQLAIDYIDRTKRDTGHTPDDEEILIYLADEKTTDLHKRLIERDDQLARLAEGRR